MGNREDKRILKQGRDRQMVRHYPAQAIVDNCIRWAKAHADEIHPSHTKKELEDAIVELAEQKAAEEL